MTSKFILVLVFILSQCKLYSQQDTDISLIKFEPSECQDEYNIYSINNRIVSIEKIDNVSIIEVSVRANCCINLKGDIQVQGDTVDLIFNKFEKEWYINETGDTMITIQEECDCDCCFSFKYHILGLDSSQVFYRVNKKIIELSNHKYIVRQEPNFKVLNGDTIDYIDIYGFRQGVFKRFDKQGREVAATIYKNDEPVSGLFRRVYYESGKIEAEYYLQENKSYKVIYFNEKGKAIKECIQFDFWDNDESNCIEYDKN